jgi:hypothetical protein
MMLHLILALTSTLSTFCLKITDKNGEPIPFATVVNKDNSYGVLVDAQGEVCIEADLLKDSVIIHSMGFKNRIITKRQLLDLKSIVLEENAIELKEVVVKSSKPRVIEMGHFSKRNITFGISMTADVDELLACYISNTLEKDLALTKLKFRFSPHKEDFIDRYVLRLRLWENLRGKPSTDIAIKNMVFEIKAGEKFLEVDVEKEAMILPKLGFWMALEPVGYYDKENNFNHIESGSVGKVAYKDCKDRKNKTNFNITPSVETDRSSFYAHGYGRNLKNEWERIDFMGKFFIPMFGVEVRE